MWKCTEGHDLDDILESNVIPEIAVWTEQKAQSFTVVDESSGEMAEYGDQGFGIRLHRPAAFLIYSVDELICKESEKESRHDRLN